jgi:hypothetical protein
MKNPYKEGTTLEQILADGWCRGFDPRQTQKEAETMGYRVSIAEIAADWKVR